jgi:histidinol-phosphatase (PHP family)
MEDWHTHSSLCRHAEGTLEDYVKKAIDHDLNSIGFSDHFPYEFLKNINNIPFQEYSMTLEEIEDYLSVAELLREKYETQIQIKIGFELDFLIDQEKALNEHLNNYMPRLDYLLGSLHIQEGQKGTWCLDDERFLNNYKAFGIDHVYVEYYQKMQKMLTSKEFDFDIISHFDLPKKFNKIPTNKELIENEVNKTLELIKKGNYVVEINTGGIRKDINEQYPSRPIIKKMYEFDIPILLGSDAHDPNEVGYEFNNMIKILSEIGYTQLASFDKRVKSFIDI